MIVRRDKTYETNSLFLNVNWYEGEDNYVIDETTEGGKILAEKIKAYFPYFEFVLDEEGNLIDVIPTEIPDPDPVIPEPSLEDYLLDLDFRLSMLELGI